MTDPKHIPYLVQLLDDDPAVSHDAAKELYFFGPNLRRELKKISFPLNQVQTNSIENILVHQKNIWIKQSWSSWYKIENPYERLEKAVTVLSHFLSDPFEEVRVQGLLDGLAKLYRRRYKVKDPKLLAHFLFKIYGLKGDEEDYYNPNNSNLIYAIQEKKGIPITLATIYILVGYRIGIPIEGCHFPGHFLARIKSEGRRAFVDCFSEGQIIYEEDIVRVREEISEGIEDILKEKFNVDTMVRRYLANLVRAYQLRESESDSALMINLFKDLDAQTISQNFYELTPEDIIREGEPSFQPGEVVRHRRYGYRGIIVDSDRVCEASDGWYYSNQTQPDRDQPWFHILVDGSDQVTYVAESNLEYDEAEEKIEHPLLNYFFQEEDNGQYIRNENDWPDTELS